MKTVSNISHALLVSELRDNFTEPKLVVPAMKEFCLKLVLLHWCDCIKYTDGFAISPARDHAEKTYKFIRAGTTHVDFSIASEFMEAIAGQHNRRN